MGANIAQVTSKLISSLLLINHLRKKLNLLIMVAIGETVLEMKVSVSIWDSPINLTTKKK